MRLRLVPMEPSARRTRWAENVNKLRMVDRADCMDVSLCVSETDCFRRAHRRVQSQLQSRRYYGAYQVIITDHSLTADAYRHTHSSRVIVKLDRIIAG